MKELEQSGETTWVSRDLTVFAELGNNCTCILRFVLRSWKYLLQSSALSLNPSRSGTCVIFENMPINRSPTPTLSLLASLKNPLHHSSSEPDIIKTDQLVSIDSEFLNVTHRSSKRKCIELGICQDNDLSTFLEFKKQQNCKYEKLCVS